MIDFTSFNWDIYKIILSQGTQIPHISHKGFFRAPSFMITVISLMSILPTYSINVVCESAEWNTQPCAHRKKEGSSELFYTRMMV